LGAVTHEQLFRKWWVELSIQMLYQSCLRGNIYSKEFDLLSNAHNILFSGVVVDNWFPRSAEQIRGDVEVIDVIYQPLEVVT